MPLSWDYVAGFFDGEGSPLIRRRVPDKNHKKGWSERVLQFSNTNRYVLALLQEFMHAGRVNMNRKAKGNWSTSYTLRISKAADVKRIAEELVKRCVLKKEGLEDILASFAIAEIV